MRWISDSTVGRLQESLQLPDLAHPRYRAVKFLARGGMGTVWLAEDTALHRRVAVKILDADDRADAPAGDLAARLEREALVLARLEHPGIVPVHDAGRLVDGRVFYCMKYVEGETLDRHVNGMTLTQRLQLLLRIAEPLAFAHSQGVLHRDLKPGNIMIGAFGEVLIMDWGLAKVSGELQEAQERDHGEPSAPRPDSRTAHGSVLGTPGYMSPEQARGEHDLDERTDVFSFGAVLGFMLAGQSGRVGAPKALKAICDKATAADRSQRYRTVQEMSGDLRRFLDGEPVSAYREGPAEIALRFYRRYKVAVVLVLAYVIMRVLFIFFSGRG